MTEKKKLADVFKTVGLPPYTYVKPALPGRSAVAGLAGALRPSDACVASRRLVSHRVAP